MFCSRCSRCTLQFAGWMGKIYNRRSTRWCSFGCVTFVVARTLTVVFLAICLIMVSTVLIQMALALCRASLFCFFCCYVTIKTCMYKPFSSSMSQNIRAKTYYSMLFVTVILLTKLSMLPAQGRAQQGQTFSTSSRTLQ